MNKQQFWPIEGSKTGDIRFWSVLLYSQILTATYDRIIGRWVYKDNVIIILAFKETCAGFRRLTLNFLQITVDRIGNECTKREHIITFVPIPTRAFTLDEVKFICSRLNQRWLWRVFIVVFNYKCCFRHTSKENDASE